MVLGFWYLWHPVWALGSKQQQHNLLHSPLCLSLSPKVPSWSAFSSLPFRVFYVSFMYNAQGFKIYLAEGQGEGYQYHLVLELEVSLPYYFDSRELHTFPWHSDLLYW